MFKSLDSYVVEDGKLTPCNLGSNDNLLINGNFDIWQRGISQNVSGFGSADRWNRWHSNPVLPVGSHIVSRGTFPIGQADVPNNPAYFMRHELVAGIAVNQYAGFGQPIENIRLFSGKTVTLSFWAKADSEKNIAISCAQHFGIGGYETIHYIGLTIIPLTTGWKYYTVTTEMPSTEGKEIAAGNFTNLTITLRGNEEGGIHAFPELRQQTGTFDFAQVKLEIGDRATPFVPRTITEELALCRRYYQERSTGTVHAHDLRSAMRVVPTITQISQGRFGYDAEI
jgi:hypothetical protein